MIDTVHPVEDANVRDSVAEDLRAVTLQRVQHTDLNDGKESFKLRYKLDGSHTYGLVRAVVTDTEINLGADDSELIREGISKHAIERHARAWLNRYHTLFGDTLDTVDIPEVVPVRPATETGMCEEHGEVTLDSPVESVYETGCPHCGREVYSYIRFDSAFDAAISTGAKTLTARYDFNRDLTVGETVGLVTDDAELIEMAEITLVMEMTVAEFVKLNPDGHAGYESVDEITERLAEYYDRPEDTFSADTPLTVIGFDVDSEDAAE